MKRSILSILLLCYVIAVYAQPSKFNMRVSFGLYDEAIDVVEAADGNFVAVGNSLPTVPSNRDIVVVKFSPAGTILMSKTISANADKRATSIRALSDGGFLITGQYYYFNSNEDALIIKIDSLFDVQFFKTYGLTFNDEIANSCFETTPGNYYVVGSTGILVLDTIGNLTREIDIDSCYCIGTASPNLKGNYLGNGVISLYGLSDLVHLIDTNGTTLKTIHQEIYNGGSNIIYKNNDGNFLVSTGVFNSTFNSHGLGLVLFNSVTDTVVWKKLHQKYLYDSYPVGISQDSSGNYYAGVNIGPWSNGTTVPGIIKTDSAGNFIWSKAFVDSSIVCSYLNKFIPTSDGGFLIAGQACLSAGGAMTMQFIKCDTAGSAACTTTSWSMNTFSLSLPTVNFQVINSDSTIVNSVTPITFIPTPTSAMLCSPTGINENSIASNINIFPNPNSGNFIIEVSDYSLENSLLTVTSIIGAQLQRSELNLGENEINLNLPSGIYFLTVSNKSGSYTTKIIVQ